MPLFRVATLYYEGEKEVNDTLAGTCKNVEELHNCNIEGLKSAAQ